MEQIVLPALERFEVKTSGFEITEEQTQRKAGQKEICRSFLQHDPLAGKIINELDEDTYKDHNPLLGLYLRKTSHRGSACSSSTSVRACSSLKIFDGSQSGA